MKKRPLPRIIGNWKTFPATEKEAVTFIKKLEAKVRLISKSKDLYHLAVPDIFLKSLQQHAKQGSLGVQNISGTTLGQTTGQTTPSMLCSAGASFALLGHSEVRAQGESLETIAKKCELALLAKLPVVLCIGEQERDKHGHYLKTLEEELRIILEHVTKENFAYLTLAYEPVWAIGQAQPATVHECFEVVIALRRALASLVGIDHAKKVSILYGGSVDASNALTFIQEGGVDGLLVGRASCDVSTFTSLIKVTL